jgi:hypothetical protein
LRYYYDAFGLSIESALPLPELVESPSRLSDVVITIDRGARRPEVDGFHQSLGVTQDGVWFAFGGAMYFVRGGHEIIIQTASEADERLVRLPLFGTVLAILLHQRGRLVLHGSAVSINGKAAVFLGHKGWGKSTLAATLYGRGHPLLSDDVASVDSDPGTRQAPVIHPGFAMFKLWPDAAASALGDDSAALPRIAAQSEKRVRRAETGFSSEPVALGAIYILAGGDDATIEPFSASEATLKLIAHSFVARLGSQALQGREGMRHLEQCAHLARTVPCYLLARPRSMALLGLTARSVTDHMRGLAPEQPEDRVLAPSAHLIRTAFRSARGRPVGPRGTP